ncbi:diaminopimelate decarboxylase [Streptomyces sp. ISL-86]|nr:diaminopimelate decarboxylase [Streptomyces sp. ISL-86]
MIVNSAARTDLLGSDRTEELARAQYRSLRRLAALPDPTAVWPTHGAGSFCSAIRGDERTSTIGGQKQTNPLLAAPDEDAFVRQLVAGLGGELALALAGGVDPARIVVHGNAKTDAELRTAVDAGAGLIVIDNFDDIDRLERIVTDEQPVLVRVTPGIRPETHAAVSTGQEGSKFGLTLPQARQAIARLRGSGRLRLDGVHVHIGSQILDTEPFARAVEAVAGLGTFAVYDLGGGLGARYTYEDHPPSVEEYLDALVDAARRVLPEDAHVIIEPGRSMVAESGVTLYRVATVKRGEPAFVAVDGGMADNLEVALYGQRFEATVATRVGGGDPCHLVGRHCESGDTLSPDVPLRDPRPGDLIAVPVTGAYTYSLGNNYSGALRPPVVFCQDGEARAVVRRETYGDLLRRDLR